MVASFDIWGLTEWQGISISVGSYSCILFMVLMNNCESTYSVSMTSPVEKLINEIPIVVSTSLLLSYIEKITVSGTLNTDFMLLFPVRVVLFVDTVASNPDIVLVYDGDWQYLDCLVLG